MIPANVYIITQTIRYHPEFSVSEFARILFLLNLKHHYNPTLTASAEPYHRIDERQLHASLHHLCWSNNFCWGDVCTNSLTSSCYHEGLETRTKAKNFCWDDAVPFGDLFSIMLQSQGLCSEDKISPSMLLPECDCCIENSCTVNIQ